MRALLRSCAVALCLVVPLAAQAVIPRVYDWVVNSGNAQTPASHGTSAEAACQAFVAAATARDQPSYVYALTSVTLSSSTAGICNYTESFNGQAPANRTTPVSAANSACPANSTTNGVESCSCTAPYVENQQQTACVLPPSLWEQKCNSVAGQGSGHLEWAGTGNNACGNPGGLASNQGCLVVAGDIKVTYQTAPGVWTSGSDTGSYTGATCVPNDTAPAASKDPCIGGESGTVNGKIRCVPLDPSTPATQTDSTTTTNADGSTTTTTESTTCNAGKCTTTSTSTTTGGSGAGNGTSTTSTTEGIGDYCKKNPETALCRKTNDGAGAETGEEESDGPCDDKSTIIGCMKPGAPPADQQIPKKELVYGLGGVPIGGFSAACPNPTTFAIFGKTFAMSYEPLCDSAGWIKPLILLVAGLASALIVYRSLGGS